MELWAHINGKDYPVATGATFSDDLSETLDGGNISLPHVAEILDIKPYDDIVVHDYGNGKLPNRPFGERFYPVDGHFYRHMLIWTVTREQVSISDSDRPSKKNGEGDSYLSYYFNYSISLISETKGLETVQMPNRAITQPIGTADGSPDYAKANSFGLKIATTATSSKLAGRLLSGGGAFGDRYYVNSYPQSGPSVSQFTTMHSEVASSSGDVLLPDWQVSGVYVYREYYFLGTPTDYRGVQASAEIKKHWVVFSKQTGDQSLNDKATALAKVKAAIAAGGDGVYSSNSWYSSVVHSFSNGSFRVFLYVEPYEYDLNGKSYNLTGMSSDGSVPEMGTDGEFLAYWDVTVSDSGELSPGAITVYEAARQAIELYSPFVKVCRDGKTWNYERKYRLGDELLPFKSKAAPEMTENMPNLRAFLSKLFAVGDCIPVVHDGEIGILSLAKRSPTPFYTSEDKNRINREVWAMDGTQYSDRLLREYSGALSRNSVVRCVERKGFRAMNSPTLTLGNMVLKLDHPIYQIKKMLMCYYVEAEGEFRLVKQNITPLVLLNQQRNLLSTDWDAFQDNTPKNLEELAKYKFCTVGYDVGSDTISGWGTMYEYPYALFWKARQTYIENIYEWFSARYPLGTEPSGLRTTHQISLKSGAGMYPIVGSNGGGTAFAYGEGGLNALFQEYPKGYTSFTNLLKTMVFVIEYSGFVSAPVIASKDVHDGPVVTRDNQSASLSYVEDDGVNQKEKANRLGNATLNVHARAASLSELHELAEVWDDEVAEGEKKVHDDEVVYKRSFTVFKDYLDVNYVLASDYVIRNYFTSVLSRLRPFSLMSYGESVERNENKTLEVLFSPDKLYKQAQSEQIITDPDILTFLISFFRPTEYDGNGTVSKEHTLDSAFYVVPQNRYVSSVGQRRIGVYAADFQTYVSGDSLCVTVGMVDSSSGGVCVSKWNPTLGSAFYEYWENVGKYFGTDDAAAGQISYQDALELRGITGAKQEWLMFPVDAKSGMLYRISFGVGKVNADDAKEIWEGGGSRESDDYEDDSFAGFSSAMRLPFYDVALKECGDDGYASYDFGGDGNNSVSRFAGDAGPSEIGKPRLDEAFTAAFRCREDQSDAERKTGIVFKDNKEKMSVTMQFEPVSEDGRVMFSGKMMGLSDIVGPDVKANSEEEHRTAADVELMIEQWTVWEGEERAVTAKIIDTQAEGTLKDADENNGLSSFWYRPSARIVFYMPNDVIEQMAFQKVSINGGAGLTLRWDGSRNGKSYSYAVTVLSLDSLSYAADESGALSLAVTVNAEYSVDGTAVGELTMSGRQIIMEAAGQNDAFPPQKGGKTAFVFSESRWGPTKKDGSDGFYYPTAQSGSETIIGWFMTGTSHNNVSGRLAAAEENGSFVFGNVDGISFWNDLSATDETYIYFDQYNGQLYREPEITTSISPSDPVSKEGASTELEPEEWSEANLVLRNMFWAESPDAMTKDTPFGVLPSLSGMDVLEYGEDEDVVCSMSGSSLVISLKSDFPYESGSIRLYRLEDGVYRFVFGINTGPSAAANREKETMYPTGKGGRFEYVVYVSLIDDRSKKVIDAATGDATLRRKNYAGNDSGEANLIE